MVNFLQRTHSRQSLKLSSTRGTPQRKRGRGGFTLVELLVVVVILVVLAAIAVPLFLNQRAKASRAAVVADGKTLNDTLNRALVDVSEPDISAITWTDGVFSGGGLPAVGSADEVRAQVGEGVNVAYQSTASDWYLVVGAPSTGAYAVFNRAGEINNPNTSEEPLATMVAAVGATHEEWSPLNLPNLNGWWDASDTATITESGGDVSQWGDKSGNGYDLVQGIEASQPATGTATVNGLNVLTFDGTNDSLSVASFDMDTTKQTFSIAAVFSVAPSDDGMIFEHSANANFSAGAFRLYVDGADRPNMAQQSGASGYTQRVGNALPSPSPATIITTHDGTLPTNEVSMWVDGDSSGFYMGNPDGNVNNRIDTLYVGARGGSLYFLNGTIAELIITTDVLTTKDREALQEYLSEKWETA